MYVQASFSETDREKLLALAARHPFATVITPGADELWVSHVPLLVKRRDGAVVLAGHLARANAHWKTMEGGAVTTAIFHGPHAYVSPTWYATSPAVPTWNYVVVHATGKARVHHDGHDLTDLLRELTAQYEGRQAGAWSPDRLPDGFAQPMRGAIVGFELAVERLEGKLKLSQNRSAEDRRGVVAALEAQMSEDSRAIATLMRQTEP
ncbi:MAG TPA: FMN-binding negative transcriptional regulator [Polyangia bacterium]|nr:FMN-binding negative transcriptional regulator [Polyangia bacterium]